MSKSSYQQIFKLLLREVRAIQRSILHGPFPKEAYRLEMEQTIEVTNQSYCSREERAIISAKESWEGLHQGGTRMCWLGE